MADDTASPGCCATTRGLTCVFAKALLSRAASCELSTRDAVAERIVVGCRSPVSRTNCATLGALLRERARFALKLPPPSQPLMHVQALRLQCGGLVALQDVLASADADVHRLVTSAQARHGSLTDLPWAALVATLATWQPRRRHRPQP